MNIYSLKDCLHLSGVIKTFLKAGPKNKNKSFTWFKACWFHLQGPLYVWLASSAASIHRSIPGSPLGAVQPRINLCFKVTRSPPVTLWFSVNKSTICKRLVRSLKTFIRLCSVNSSSKFRLSTWTSTTSSWFTCMPCYAGSDSIESKSFFWPY